MWLKDPKNDKKSASLTILMITFVFVLLKLLLADLEYNGLKMGPFSGTEFATVFGSVAALYGFRKHTDKDKD